MTAHGGENQQVHVVGDSVPHPDVPMLGPREWTCEFTRVGTGFHVRPVKHMLCTGNWALNPYHRRGLGNFCAQVWRMFSATYLRREYPKTEKALHKAISECEAWCEAENGLERAARSVLVRTAVRRTVETAHSGRTGATDGT